MKSISKEKRFRSTKWSVLHTLAVTITSCGTCFAETQIGGATYPDRPIRLIIPQAPGSSNDTATRIAAAKIGELLGQQIVIDNRPGAAGIIGAQLAARAPANGYTLLSGSVVTHALAQINYRKIPYEPNQDFAPISQLYNANVVLCISPSMPAKSVKEFIAFAKGRPGELNMASAGTGSAAHLAGRMFAEFVGIKSVDIQYKGVGNVVAVVSGEAQWLISPVGALMGQIRSGRLRALAYGGSERSSFLPDVPTFDESGVSGYAFFTWSGLMAPANTPRSVIEKLHAATVKALTLPEVREQYAAHAVEPHSSTNPEEFARFIIAEQVKLLGLARRMGLHPE